MSHTVRLKKRILRHFYEIFRGDNRVETSKNYFSFANARRAAKKRARDIKGKFVQL